MQEREKRKILVVVAHPDDAEISMGMKIFDEVSKGHEVYIHCLSKGSVSDPMIADIRVKECLNAKNILGIKEYSFSDITDTRFIAERIQINLALFKVINEIRPDTIYTHYPEDQHLDHRVTAEEVLIVAEREVPNIRYFQSPYSKKFVPNLFFFGNDEHMEKKFQALLCFASQKQFNMSTLKLLSSVAYHQFLHHRIMKEVQKNHVDSTLYVEMFAIEREIEFERCADVSACKAHLH